jgi:NAD(P)-dependent dehydrogenase (short-subunit alcohol dehydrogenase family)
MMRLEGKVALVTGGGSGIGRATCSLFAREGASVVVAGLPTDPLDEVVSSIRTEGYVAEPIAGDVRLASDCAALVDAAVRRFGALDVLFSNAGVEFVGDIEETPEDRWDLVLDTNLKSMYQMARFAVPEMRRRGKGVIINNASQLAFAGAAKFSAYCASKGGVVSLTRALALELAPFNIRVNALCPGAVETPLLMRQFTDGRGPQGSLDDLIRMHALGRLAQPIELAYPALFLASDESSFMTGSALIVDGGYLAG